MNFRRRHPFEALRVYGCLSVENFQNDNNSLGQAAQNNDNNRVGQTAQNLIGIEELLDIGKDGATE